MPTRGARGLERLLQARTAAALLRLPAVRQRPDPVDRPRLLGLQGKVAEPGRLLADSYNEARSATPPRRLCARAAPSKPWAATTCR
ncbi:hypothetical protein [Delftia sp.]|uniref:hypothetical protein n=1 Tax=Delftia sp. TaxID=1886637 RepID=UPI00259CDFE6|nr:hypothetical protein [Delftia sp.]